MANIDEILVRLDKVRRVKNGRYVACCPVHDDKKPSLSITETSDDKIIMHCFGCGANGLEVCNALAVDVSCLFPDDTKNYHKNDDNVRNRDPMSQFVAEQVVLNIQDDVLFVAFLARDLASGASICESDIERLKNTANTLLTNMKKII